MTDNDKSDKNTLPEASAGATLPPVGCKPFDERSPAPATIGDALTALQFD